MKRKARISRMAAAWIVAILVALPITGCSTLKSKETSNSSGAPAGAPPADTTPVYYDFGDVMLPRELSVDKGGSFVMHSGGMTSGILALKGRVDSNSLVTFFENKMPVDGWRQMGSFRSARSIMLFIKKDRWCVIQIDDGSFKTQVEIWVAPTTSGGGGIQS